MIVGITGGIASGKSAVSTYLKSKGYFVIDCDIITKELYSKESFVDALINLFGNTVLTNGEFDKAKLRTLVFENPKELKKLNELCYPLILERINELRAISKTPQDVYIDAPTLFESGLDKDVQFDQIWVVSIPRNLQIERLKKRNPNLTETDIENILKRQLSTEEKVKRGTHVIDNSMSLEYLYERIEEIMNASKSY